MTPVRTGRNQRLLLRGVVAGAVLVLGIMVFSRRLGHPTEETHGAEGTANRSAPIVYVPLPMENPAATVAVATPLVDMIRERTGLHLSIRHYTEYETILDEFAAGRIDLAHLGPLPLIALRMATSKAVPIVAFREPDGSASYRCVLAVPFDADEVTTMAEVGETGRIALTQPLSTCGYLSTVWLLRRRGVAVETGSYTYLGSHEAVALSIARGESRIGGIKDEIAARYDGLGVRIVDETEPLPGFAIVANAATMSADQIADVRTALLNMSPTDLAEFDLGRHGFAEVDEAAYNRVSDMLSEIDVSFTSDGAVQW